MTGTKYVVVGNGMVGLRFVSDLNLRLRRSGTKARITLIGDEPYGAYNRLLLSDVVAGKTNVAALQMPAAPAGVRVVRGQAVTCVDRVIQCVRTDAGEMHEYDHLILATGAAAFVPPIPGLYGENRLASGVRVLRTLDDARGLIAAASTAARVTVVGGGVLGIEVATGLHARGSNVTVLHMGDYPLDRQLDADSGGVLASNLGTLGITVETNVKIEHTIMGDGKVRALALADGRYIESDLIVVAAGIKPNIGLADTAGLTVDFGIVVDESLRSVDDPMIHAIGDCAQPPEGCTGLLAPGWSQARRLAALLADGEQAAPHLGGDDVVRLKAVGADAIAIGDPRHLTPGSDCRVIALSDPAGGRSIKVAVDADRLVAAVCVGAVEIGAELASMYERSLPIPLDPAHLLLDRSRIVAPAAAENLTRIPDSATMCRCNGVTKGQLIAAYRAGDRTVADLAARTRATTGCGGCTPTVKGTLDWLIDADPDQSTPRSEMLHAVNTT